MKISITYRLFLSILTATCLALLCMFLIMQWSINQGFLQYLNAMEQGRLEQISRSLNQAYAEHGNWDFLHDNPRFWFMRQLKAMHDDAEAEGLKAYMERRNLPPIPPPPPVGAHPPRLRFIVLDAEKKTIFGNTIKTDEVKFKAIVHNNEIVGYIGLLPPKQFLNPHQVQFLKQQKSALILAAFGMVLVVVIFALPLANSLVRPIRVMAAATHDIASGKYSVRVPVSSSDELGQLASDFNAMALALDKNEKARRQWVADISHELRTPLAVLRGEIEALLEGIRKATPDAIRSLHAEAIRLNHLVDDLYQLSLSDLGRLTYNKEDTDLAEVLSDSVEHYRSEFIRKDIKLKTDVSQGFRIMVFADQERLHQLFSNLLDNSLKYTDTGGELVIRLVCHNGQAVIDFEDSAPSVPGNELDRLFDRLYRVEGSRSRSSGGAGLGLAISKNIVEAHAGTISSHLSRLGGLMIRITIPVSGGCS